MNDDLGIILVKDKACKLSLKNRIQVHSGLERVNSLEFDSLSYIPGRHLMDPTDMTSIIEEQGLCEKFFSCDEEYIAILSLPSDILDSFQLIRSSIAKHNNSVYVDNMFRHSSFKKGCRDLLAWLGRTEASDIHYLGHYYRKPGLQSCSINASGKYIGLHVDSWSGKNVSERLSPFPYRVCVNLGPEPRYFTFVPVALKRIKEDKLYRDIHCPNAIVSSFLQSNEGIPVIRIMVMPGEAYVAPTETIIHDANTINKLYLDASITVLGNFSIRHVKKIIDIEPTVLKCSAIKISGIQMN